MLDAGLGLLALFALLLAGVPIGFGMLVVGIVGFALLTDWTPSFAMLGQIAFRTVLSYELSVIPLFLLMGNLIARSRLSEDLYAASNALVGGRRGGLAMSTIVACGGFAALCGSSLATVATMGQVAMPPMRKAGYDDRLASGAVAAGGTLGILIPPSVPLVLYGIITQTDIGKLFAAGLLPGILGVLCYLAAIAAVVARRPGLGPRVPVDAEGRWRPLRRIWSVLALFLFVLGGIYFGVFTATEAAGIGSVGALAFALGRRLLGLRALRDTLVETGRTTAALFVILIGSLVFANFVNAAGAPQQIVEWVSSLDVPPFAVILVLFAIYLVLGCVLESISMMLLTVPIFFPVAVALGYDPIWFGIIVVVAIEISLITPPIGLNLFVLRTVFPELPLATLYRGVWPFVLADVVRFLLIAAIPAIALFLPGLM
jgi:C4-dicarboxylate transporter DctM subunit